MINYIFKNSFYFEEMLFFLVSNQHIKIFSEGSCDTENWSTDAENSALHHRKKKIILSIFK